MNKYDDILEIDSWPLKKRVFVWFENRDQFQLILLAVLPITVLLGPILLLLIREFFRPDSAAEEKSTEDKDDILEAKRAAEKDAQKSKKDD